jgi:hypothetical protein
MLAWPRTVSDADKGRVPPSLVVAFFALWLLGAERGLLVAVAFVTVTLALLAA